MYPSFLPYLFSGGKKCPYTYTNVRITCALDAVPKPSPAPILTFCLCSCSADLSLSTGPFGCHTYIFHYYLLSLYRKKILTLFILQYHLIFLPPFKSKYLIGIIQTRFLCLFPSNLVFNKLTSVFHISTKATLLGLPAYLTWLLPRLDSPSLRLSFWWLQDRRSYALSILSFSISLSSSTQFLTVGMLQSSDMGPVLSVYCLYSPPRRSSPDHGFIYHPLVMLNFIFGAPASPFGNKFIYCCCCCCCNFYFYFLAIMNTAMAVHMQVSEWTYVFISLRLVPMSWIAELYGKLNFHF